MNTPSDPTTFKGDEDAQKFSHFHENMITKSLPDSERAETTVAFLSDAVFDFYFDSFNLDNACTEEAQDHGVVKKVRLEEFSTQKTESDILREAINSTFLSRAIKVHNQAKVGENVKFEPLSHALKYNQIFF